MENIILYKAEKSSHNPLLTKPREIHRSSYSLPSILPSHFLELFFLLFIFWESFFPLSEKDSNSVGPNPPAKNKADIEVQAVPAKAPTEASSSTSLAKENCLSKSHQRVTFQWY